MHILDAFDDPQLGILKQASDAYGGLPAILHEAHPLKEEDLDKLHDHDFALVWPDGKGGQFRKFACVDPGWTTMSCIYFTETHDVLTPMAKVATALALAERCKEFGLPYSSLLKVAEDNGWAPNEDEKEMTFAKTAMVQDAIESHWGKPITSRHEQDMAESDFLLNGRFPCTSIDHIKTAEAYFKDNWKEMHPDDRREFCTNLYKKASERVIDIHKGIAKYAGRCYAKNVKSAVLKRKEFVPDDLHGAVEKMAAATDYTPPDTFVHTLDTFDKLAGIDHFHDSHLPDPWWSVFDADQDKLAEYVWAEGAERVTGPQLVNVSVNQLDLVREQFGDEFANEFAKDPMTIFHSLPTPKKKILSRMAADDYFSGGTQSAVE